MAFDVLKQDLAYAVRGFRREPSLAAIAILILALGIGANTAVFSIVNPLVLRSLPFPDADQLVWIENTGGTGLSGTTYRSDVFAAVRDNARSFQGVSGYFAFFGFLGQMMTGRGDPERLSVVDLAPRFFEVLGVRPASGRLFTEAEHHAGGPRAVMLTHGFWQRRLAAAPGLIGSTLTLNGAAVTIVGILPPGFDFTSVFAPGAYVDVFRPADLDVLRPMGNTLSLVARLRPGVTIAAARAEMAVLFPQWREQHRDWGGWGASLSELQTHVSGSMRRPLLLLWFAVGFVLLIVCANLANLLLARASVRGREFAVRIALGAQRARLIRQVLTEGVLLALVGAALAVPFAYGLTTWLTRSERLVLPLLHYVRLDAAAFAVTAALAVLTGLLFAAVPALRVSAHAPQDALQEHSRGTVDSKRQALLRRCLVVAEIALAAVLLVGAGLLSRSFIRLVSADPGFRSEQVIAARIEFASRTTQQEILTLAHELSRRLRALPGVDAAGLTDALPLDRNRSWNVAVPGVQYPNNLRPGTFLYMVGPGYLRTMGIQLKAGRDFSDQDVAAGATAATRAVILNETLARTLYPGVDPIGRPAITGRTPLTIVGIVADVRQSSLDETPAPQMYLAWAQGGGAPLEIVVRSSLPGSAPIPMLRRTMAEVDSRLIAADVRLIQDLVETTISPRRFVVSLLGGFSLLAVLLACLGIYGVVSYGVHQRMTEIGLRMALGATGRDVRAQILGDTMRMTAAGITIGGVAALALSRTIAALLYATSPTDPVTFALMVLLLGTVTMIAALVPAVRAARIEPMAVLKS
jgi:putative ABC transport system permease protein